MNVRQFILFGLCAGVGALLMLSCAGDGSTLDPQGNPLGPARIGVNPGTINLTLDKGSVANLAIKIKNDGGFPLTITKVEVGVTWIQLASVALPIQLASGDSVLLPVTLGSPSLDAGTFLGTIKISSNDEKTPVFTLAVSLKVSVEVLLFEPKFSNIQLFIFSPICIECHAGSKAPKGLKLEAGDSYRLLVNVPSVEKPKYMRVMPFNPDDSYLVRKLEGGPDISDKRMPLDRPPLSREQIAVIRRWIASGAPNN